MNNDSKIFLLSVVCSLLQIVGLALIIASPYLPQSISVIIGISGFAAIVKLFLPSKADFEGKILRPAAALAGFGIIIISLI